MKVKIVIHHPNPKIAEKKIFTRIFIHDEAARMILKLVAHILGTPDTIECSINGQKEVERVFYLSKTKRSLDIWNSLGEKYLRNWEPIDA